MKGGFFRVDGADLETGEESYLVLQASTVAEAESVARKQGLLIAAVRIASSADWGATNGNKKKSAAPYVIEPVIKFESRSPSPAVAPARKVAAPTPPPPPAAALVPPAPRAPAPQEEVEPFDLIDEPPESAPVVPVAETPAAIPESAAPIEPAPTLDTLEFPPLEEAVAPANEPMALAEEEQIAPAPAPIDLAADEPDATVITLADSATDLSVVEAEALADDSDDTQELESAALTESAVPAEEAAPEPTLETLEELPSKLPDEPAVAEPVAVAEVIELPEVADEPSIAESPAALEAGELPEVPEADMAEAAPLPETPAMAEAPPIAVAEAAPKAVTPAAPAAPSISPAPPVAAAVPIPAATTPATRIVDAPKMAPAPMAGTGPVVAAARMEMASPGTVIAPASVIAAPGPVIHSASPVARDFRHHESASVSRPPRGSVFADAPLSPGATSSWMASRPGGESVTRELPAARETASQPVEATSLPQPAVGVPVEVKVATPAVVATPIPLAAAVAVAAPVSARKPVTPPVASAAVETQVDANDMPAYSSMELDLVVDEVAPTEAEAAIPPERPNRENASDFVAASSIPAAASTPAGLAASPVSAAASTPASTSAAPPSAAPAKDEPTVIKAVPVTAKPVLIPKMGLGESLRRVGPSRGRPESGATSRGGARAVPPTTANPVAKVITIVPSQPSVEKASVSAGKTPGMPRPVAPTVVSPRRLGRPTLPGAGRRPPQTTVPPTAADMPGRAGAPSRTAEPASRAEPAVIETALPAVEPDVLIENPADAASTKDGLKVAGELPRGNEPPAANDLPPSADPGEAAIAATAAGEPGSRSLEMAAPAAPQPAQISATSSSVTKPVSIGFSPLVFLVLVPLASLLTLGGIALAVISQLASPPMAAIELEKLDFHLQMLGQTFLGGILLLAGLLVFVMAGLAHVSRLLSRRGS